MAVTPKASFRLSAEAVAAIADVQALLAAKRGGKPVSQAGAIDYAIRRAAEDLRAEPQRQLSEAEWQMVEEHLPKTRLAGRGGRRGMEGRRGPGPDEIAARQRRFHGHAAAGADSGGTQDRAANIVRT